MRRLVASIAVVLAALVPAGAGAGGGTVAVKLTEFKLIPVPTSAANGKIGFTVRNAGKLEHEFVIVKSNLPPGKLPVKNGRASEKGSVGEIGDIAPGTTRKKSFSLSPGKYVLLCNLKGHYQAGQYAGFTVK